MSNICCMHCRAKYVAPASAQDREVDAARIKGWIVWEGETLGGQQVKRIYCPVCRGVAAPDTEPEPSWDAVCKTCDASMGEEWGDEQDGPFTEKDAKQWRDEHECEPWVDILPPKPREQAVQDGWSWPQVVAS